jgi:hypothetical protein
MNNPEGSGGDHDQDQPQGPNLKLYYTIIALALGAAIFLAGLIVLPFYQRR